MSHGTQPSVSLERDTSTSWLFDHVLSTALGERGLHGHVAVVERAGRSGFMAPLHRRNEDETFRVLEGQVTFFVGDRKVTAAAGQTVLAPRDVPRTFRVESERARWLVLTRVTSLARFEDFGRAISRPSSSPVSAAWPQSEEASALATIARANGIEVLGPPGALPARG